MPVVPSIDAERDAAAISRFLSVAGLQAWLREMLERLVGSLAAAGHDVMGLDTHGSTICTDPWSFTVGARPLQGDPQ